jgi:hypothetical protein
VTPARPGSGASGSGYRARSPAHFPNRLSIIIDDEKHAGVWAWWQQQENKSAAVRAAIRAALEPTPPPLTAADVRRAVRVELAQVEIAAQPAETHDEPTEDVDPEAAARLDNLF